jgi:hypothetical protein
MPFTLIGYVKANTINVFYQYIVPLQQYDFYWISQGIRVEWEHVIYMLKGTLWLKERNTLNIPS